ncbi:phage integrase N-terminal SAM-like domain-containing protein [Leptolyngbya sp. DQ-M1]
MRDAIRVRHYSYRTEEAYVQWIRRFILFHNKQHPKDMGAAEVEARLIRSDRLRGPQKFNSSKNGSICLPGWN